MNKSGYKLQSPHITNTIICILANKSEKTYRLWFAVLFCVVAFFSLLKVFSGLSPIWAPWDTINLLQGAWRIINGEIPHTDFYNPIGVLAYIPTVIGMKIGHLSSSSLVYGNVVFGLLLAFWTWSIARNRLSSFIAFILAFFIFILTISTRSLGFGITETTYAMIYNRYGYALFSMLLVQLFIPRRSSPKIGRTFEGLSTGILLALLLYCKITFFVVGLISIIVYILIYRFSTSWTAMLCVGFALVILGMLVLFHISVVDYMKNIYLAAQSQSTGSRLRDIARSIADNLLLVYFSYLFLLLSYFVTNISTLSNDDIKGFFRRSAIITLVVVSGVLLTTGNAPEGNDVPVFFISGLIILSFLPQNLIIDSKGLISSTSFFAIFMILVGLPVFMGHIFFKDISSVAYTAAWNRTRLASLPSSQRFQSASLYDFVIPINSDSHTAYWRGRDVPERINEGLDLLRRHIDKDSRIFCLCYTDPFSFGLGLTPAKGTPLWWDENFSFSSDIYPQAEDLFRNVTIVMKPLFTKNDDGCCKGTVFLMEQIYGGYLEKNFYVKDKSVHWVLLEKY